MSGTDKQTKAKVKWMNGQMDGWMDGEEDHDGQTDEVDE